MGASGKFRIELKCTQRAYTRPAVPCIGKIMVLYGQMAARARLWQADSTLHGRADTHPFPGGGSRLWARLPVPAGDCGYR